MISKKEVKRLADLARIKIDPVEIDGLFHDFENILKHFEELKEVNTENVLPVIGGTENKNIFRNDNEKIDGFNLKNSTKQFPKTNKGFLIVPHVFSSDED